MPQNCVTQNYQKARHWFTLSAGKGDAVGLRSLGYMYAAGLGMRANAAEAMKLFERSADAGDAYAKYNLALENIGARGRYFDAERTVLLLEESYRAGVVEAAAELGDFMAGSDLLEEACDWYLLAAQGGHAGAMKVLGCWYRDGELGQADNVQAIRWFLRRALAGKADGIHEALQVAKRVGPDDVREAARQADARTYGQSIISTLWS